jgi:ADP-ribose pyrophosphatase YjhB (NUDIX family)
MSKPRHKLNCSVIIEQDSGILLVQETAESVCDKFGLPGGTVNTGKKKAESILEAGIREVEEETGLLVRPIHGVGLYQRLHSAHGNNHLSVVVAAEVIGGELTPSEEHPVVDFYTPAQIEAMHSEGLLRNHVTIEAVRDFGCEQQFPLSALVVLG